ncbi:LysR substrate-binding domain-containing protein [Streptomyces spiralis]|uniref:LysR substrate-binding domain-containing protein n=1 Tax=Streptomyces spiralis TaxID=66376 RepID=UPI003689F2D9
MAGRPARVANWGRRSGRRGARTRQAAGRPARQWPHRLTIATCSSGGRLLLPQALAYLTAAHADTVVHVRECEPEESLPLVRQGAVDLALAYHFDGPLPGRPGLNSSLAWTAIMEDALHVVLPDAHPLAGHETLDIAELAAEPWVPGCLKTEAYLRRYAERAGFDPQVRGTTTDYFFARSLVAAGMGVSLIPSIAQTPQVAGVRAVPIAPPTPTRHIGVATIHRRNHTEVRTLIEALQAEAAALDET